MRDTSKWGGVAALGAGAFMVAMLLAGGCDLTITQEQEQSQQEGMTTPSDVPSPPPNEALPDIAEIRIAKFGGNCNSDAGFISANCPDPAQITCSALDSEGNHLGGTEEGKLLRPAWWGGTPFSVAVSSINAWNARASCDPADVGRTGEITCTVEVVGYPELRQSAGKIFECVQ